MTPADRRSFSRTLSRLANAGVTEALRLVPPDGESRCRRVGITGPPGAGKSSLIAKLARQRLRDDGDLAIIAIDPTSPVSGGAILGDRIRMEALATDPRVYIRSLATRMSLDGLADNLPDILSAVDRFGFAEVLIETVGVGQVEYAIRALVDTVVLVMPPGAGDQVQAMKSGILEQADICVINKADQPGARQLAADVRSVLQHRVAGPGAWEPSIVCTSVGDADSVAALSVEIDRHQAWAMQTGILTAARGTRRALHVGSLLGRRVREVLSTLPADILQQPIEVIYRTVVQELAEASLSSTMTL
jgi:LAO/AO transport system kinase